MIYTLLKKYLFFEKNAFQKGLSADDSHDDINDQNEWNHKKVNNKRSKNKSNEKCFILSKCFVHD